MRTTPPELPPFSRDAEEGLDAVLALLESLGHAVEDSHPDVLDMEGIPAQLVKLVSCHTAAGLKSLERLLGQSLGAADFDPWTWAWIERGLATSATDYLDHTDWRNVVTRGAAGWWQQGFDVLVMPTVAATAPAIGELRIREDEAPGENFARVAAYIPHAQLWNVTGQPAISLPLHRDQAGVPLGISLVAAYGKEDLLLRLAAQLEQAAPWHEHRPRTSIGEVTA